MGFLQGAQRVLQRQQPITAHETSFVGFTRGCVGFMQGLKLEFLGFLGCYREGQRLKSAVRPLNSQYGTLLQEKRRGVWNSTQPVRYAPELYEAHGGVCKRRSPDFVVEGAGRRMVIVW